MPSTAVVNKKCEVRLHMICEQRSVGEMCSNTLLKLHSRVTELFRPRVKLEVHVSRSKHPVALRLRAQDVDYRR